jgi:hypothetical protein
MKIRRLLLVGVVAGGALLGLAPSAQAKPGACAWVDPYGVCVSNPLENLPRLPSIGGLTLP